MRKTLFILALIGVVGVQGAQARDVEHNLSIAEFMADAEVRQKAGQRRYLLFQRSAHAAGRQVLRRRRHQSQDQFLRQARCYGLPLGDALGAHPSARSCQAAGRQRRRQHCQLLQERHPGEQYDLRMPRGKRRGRCGAERHCGRGRNRGSAACSARARSDASGIRRSQACRGGSAGPDLPDVLRPARRRLVQPVAGVRRCRPVQRRPAAGGCRGARRARPREPVRLRQGLRRGGHARSRPRRQREPAQAPHHGRQGQPAGPGRVPSRLSRHDGQEHRPRHPRLGA